MDLNPLHMIDELNNAIGKDTASVLEFLHLTDPAVKPDGVRDVAKKWQALARAVDDAQHQANTALKDVVWEGKAADAFQHRTQKVQNQAVQISGALRKGAAAVNSFADEAENLIDQIGKIAAELIEFEAAGLALSVLTAGFSEAASTIAAGERAMKIAALIERIEESGSVLGRAIKAVTEAIRGLRRVLEALKDIKAIASVAKMAGEGMKFTAFTTLLEDPSAFTDPGKLADILAEGAIAGVGFGVMGKALGKGLKALSPVALQGLSKALCKLDGLIPEGSILRPSGEDGIRASIANALKQFKMDPVDVVTGDVFLTQTDVELPGLLPLVLERTHLSSYRYGGWFGSSWASTLDQRIQLDDHGVVYATADGLRLCYPIPAPGLPVLPERGPRLPLTWDGRHGGRMRITDRTSGRTYVFARPTTPAGTRHHAADLPLHAIEDRNGNRIEILYSVGGLPVEVRHHGGYRIAIDHHDRLPRITALRLLDTEGPDTSTILRRYGYDQSGNLTEVINSSGTPLRFSYDDAGRITAWTDRNGTSYTYTYDSRGRCVRGDGSDGYQSATFAYDDGNRTATVTNSLGHATTIAYNEAFRPVRETDALGNTTVTEWDADGERITAIFDPLGRTTRYTYDAVGNVVCLRRPDGTEIHVSYNSLDLAEQITRPDGTVWRHTYDQRGNVLTTTDPLGAETRYGYDDRGALRSVTDALGDTQALTCNGAGLPMSYTDPLGNTTHASRDAFGRITSVRDPLGRTTGLGWTAEGKPAWRQAPDGTRVSWEWDGEGNLLAHTDAMGSTTRYTRGHFDLAASRIGADGAVHRFAYDTELRLVGVTSPQGLTWSYTYDAAGRLTAETDFDGRTLTYTHDAAGQVVSRVNGAGEEIAFTRDLLGRTVERRSGEDSVTTYVYDPADRLVRATNAGADITFAYDPLGRPLAESVNGRTMSYTYDAVGRRTARRTPSGTLTEWAYDSAGRPTTLSSPAGTIGFTHDSIGRETERRIGTNVRLTQTWDAADRLTRQALADHIDGVPELLQDRSYAYRLDGQLIEERNRLRGARRFDLDQSGRPTAVHAEDWTENYAYDSIGNLTRAAAPSGGSPEDHTFTGTLLRRAGRTTYQHDGQGRVTRVAKRLLNGQTRQWTYTWDAEDHLIGVVTPDGSHWHYGYDPLGRRTAKQRVTADGTVSERTEFFWDGTRLAEQTVDDAKITTWDYAPDTYRPLYQLDRELTQSDYDARFHAIVTDLVGTPTELVSPDGDLVRLGNTTPWGAQLPTSVGQGRGVECPLRFPGQYQDQETGLNYNYHRYYDPETARYQSPDPLGLGPAPHPYAYVPNALHWIDPLGLAPCTAGDILGDTSKIKGWLPTEIPPESQAVIQDIREFGVEAQGAGPQLAGPSVPQVFENSGKGGGHLLPQFDSMGNPIRYREWGTVQSALNPKPGGERIITGSDGSIYYTPTHYQTYIVAKPGR